MSNSVDVSKDFYTNVRSWGNNILYRGVKNGKRVKMKIEYEPSLYLPSKKPTQFKTLNGEFLDQKKFDSMRDAKDYIKQFEGVSNASTIYGNTRYEYAFIGDQHNGMIDWDQDNILIGIIDIEVGSENGFPDPYKANEPITAITISYINDKTYVFGCGDYTTQGEEIYIKCVDEYTLCKKFLEVWMVKCPDILTGWNTKFFDIPYIINRFNKILGEPLTKKLSPWNNIQERSVTAMGRSQTAYDIMGVASLDYIELYRWYAPGGKSQESYRLDNIANVELGESKLSYDEFENLHQLYRLNYQKFIEYNIQDVKLILLMEEKLKLLELALTLAYDTKSNFEDVFAQTRMWDSMTYSYLLERNIIVPPNVYKEKDGMFEGAYVKDPQVGKHDWVASFDLNSLYPHLMMQYNISPETLVEVQDYTPEMRELVSLCHIERLLYKEIDTSKIKDVTFTPNGQFFRTDIQGFLPKMMEEMYVDRKKFKNMMLDAKREYEVETDSFKRYELEKKIARYDNLQLAKKVSLNSAYGALGSQYFRFYDLRMALAVTTSGQLSIRWIENKINEYMNTLLKTTSKDYVIASDTDSIYLRLGELVDKVYTGSKDTDKVIAFMDKVCEDKLQPFIDKSYKELADYVHAYDQKMIMKREALADKGIWTAKKRYILNVYNNEGVQYKEPHMKVMGLEMVKSSTPSAIRDKMKSSIGIILKGTEDDIHKFISDFKTEFFNLPPEDISFPRGVNGLAKYSHALSIYKSGTPIHVKGAILYNLYLKQLGLDKKYPYIQEGEKLKFTYLKMPNPIKDTVISYPGRLPTEFGLDKFVDYNMQYQKTFIDPIKVILDCMGWKTEKASTLDDFFS
jgi:DNA polymerase elongation subunit (family B)